MERSGSFLFFPAVQALCRSPTGRSFSGFKRSVSVQWLGRCMQRATLGVIYTSGEIAITVQANHSSEGLSTQLLQLQRRWPCTQRLEWVRRELDPPATFSSILSQNVQLLTNDGAFAKNVKRYVTWVRSLQPQINLLHMPQHFSQLEERKTDNDNAKKQKRKIEDSSNCSQPLTCAQVSHPVFKQVGERPALCNSHSDGTIAVLDQTSGIFSLHDRAAGCDHTFLMAEISRHMT